MDEDDLKQGQRVSYDVSGSISGTGKVVGIATNGLPIIGKSYIIEPDEPIANETYNYTHFVCPRYFIKLV